MSALPISLDAILDAIADRVAARLAERAAPARCKLLNVRQAAERIGRSSAAVRHLVNSGQIPARVTKRMGRRVFLIAEELDRWVDAQ